MINCRILSLEKVLFDENVDMVVVPSEDGELGILARHPSLLAILKPGLIKTYKGGLVSKMIKVSSGIVSITDKGCVLFMSEDGG